MNYIFRLFAAMLMFGVLSFESLSQINYSHQYNYPKFDTTYASKLLFRLENTNFIKNNEYFGVSAEGYTLLGYSIAPSVMYYAGSRLRFQAGFNAQKYHGTDRFSKIAPLISAHLKITPQMDLIMGSLRGTIHHQLSEPIYENELQYTRPVETGLQLNYNSEKIWADAWLDWEQFISRGDSFPEIFTAGISTKTKLIQTESGWNLNMPLQMVARHIGGQLNTDNTPMQSIINLSLGLDVTKKVGGFVNTIGWFGNFLTYSDLTEANALGIYNGNAIYTGLKAEGDKVVAMAGFWNADNFIAPKGSPLFQSISDHNPTAIIAHRKLLTGKLGYRHAFHQQIRFSFLFEGYYDIPNQQFDYAYGIHLAFTPSFVIAEIPFF
jgi:hypothetical protein